MCIRDSPVTDHRLAAVGHRVTHGGSNYAAPIRIDTAVVAALEKLTPLSPLHLPHNLAPIRTLLARMSALAREVDEPGVRRYGFHGLSYEYVAGVSPQSDARAASCKTVVLH